MLKLLLGLVIEVFVGVLLAGLILALAIPLLTRNDLADDVASRIIIVSVLAGIIAVALFRPGSAIRRYLKH
jgi:ABC-type Mn2+/Zn2+ transport system permease subunit